MGCGPQSLHHDDSSHRVWRRWATQGRALWQHEQHDVTVVLPGHLSVCLSPLDVLFFLQLQTERVGERSWLERGEAGLQMSGHGILG